MLASIHPLGERARGSRWWLTTSAYALGSSFGGLLLGVLAGTLGWLAPVGLQGRTRLTAVAGVCGLTAALELAYRRVRLPTWHRQVNEDWLSRYRGWVYGLGFGVQLGFGLVTIVTTASVYALVLLVGLGGSPLTGAVVGAAFGVARALPVLGLAGVHRPEQLRAVHRRVAATAGPLRQAASSVFALAALGVWWVR